jgi:RNA polymerase sigma-70 factor (ECF subfamily)
MADDAPRQPDVPARPDDELVARARRGERAAIELLFANHLHALYRYVLARVDWHSADAEDVVQETVASAVVALPKYRRESGFWAWLTAIARHKVTDHARAAAAREKRVHAVGASEEDLRKVARSLATEDLWARAEETASVQQAVARTMRALEPEDQRLLLLKYRDGQSVSAIAERMECSAKSVESLLYRARERFRQVFAAFAERRDPPRPGAS